MNVLKLLTLIMLGLVWGVAFSHKLSKRGCGTSYESDPHAVLHGHFGGAVLLHVDDAVDE